MTLLYGTGEDQTSKSDNVGITIIDHLTIDSWYKPFPNGWFNIVIPTLRFATGEFSCFPLAYVKEMVQLH